MSTTVYDGNRNIVQTIAGSATGDPEQGVVSPLTSAAFNGVIDPTGAPNAFSTTTDRGAGGKTTAFSVTGTNGSGQACFTATNPA